MNAHQIHQVARSHSPRDVFRREGVKTTERSFCCPWHDDRSSSGSFFSDKGHPRWRCHACNITGDSIDAVIAFHPSYSRVEAARLLEGQPVSEPPVEITVTPSPFPADKVILRPDAIYRDVLFKGRDGPTRRSYTASATYPYYAGQDCTLLVLRVDDPRFGKKFIQLRYDSEKGYVSRGWQDGEPRSLYRAKGALPKPDAPVLLVEGEKCVETLAALPAFDDYEILTWSGGAKAVSKIAWDAHLSGRDVILWPDADLPRPEEAAGEGEQAMRKIAARSRARSVQLLIPPEEWTSKDVGYDAADLLADVKDGMRVRSMMQALLVPWQPPAPPGPGPGGGGGGGGGVDYLLTQEGGLAVKEDHNLALFLSRDARFPHKVTMDMTTGGTLFDGEPLEPKHAMAANHLAGTLVGLRGMNKTRTLQHLVDIGREHPVNPLADLLDGLVWDGVHRDLLDYAGVLPSPWSKAAGWRWLLGLARRMRTPGTKHDLVLVLEGPQGSGKSSFFKVMGEPFGRKGHIELDRLSYDKDVQQKLGGRIVVELSEIVALRKGDTETVKSLLTAVEDTYRPPYARETATYPRTCVFGASTNEERYLRDLTGNRRYLPVKIEAPMRLDALRKDLPQLLAEALAHPQEPNWLTAIELELQGIRTEARLEDDAAFDGLAAIVANASPQHFIDRNALWGELHIPADRRSNKLVAGLTKAMQDLGYEYKFRRVDGKPTRGFFRIDTIA